LSHIVNRSDLIRTNEKADLHEQYFSCDLYFNTKLTMMDFQLVSVLLLGSILVYTG